MEILKAGVCVKTCPSADPETKVDCVVPNTMNNDPEVLCGIEAGYEDNPCVCELVAGAGDIAPFRYDTVATPWGNGFCVPYIETEQSEDTTEASQ